jgi:hypothetical protein
MPKFETCPRCKREVLGLVLSPVREYDRVCNRCFKELLDVKSKPIAVNPCFLGLC